MNKLYLFVQTEYYVRYTQELQQKIEDQRELITKLEAQLSSAAKQTPGQRENIVILTLICLSVCLIQTDQYCYSDVDLSVFLSVCYKQINIVILFIGDLLVAGCYCVSATCYTVMYPPRQHCILCAACVLQNKSSAPGNKRRQRWQRRQRRRRRRPVSTSPKEPLTLGRHKTW